MLKEPGKRAQSRSYLWALRGGDPSHPLIYYEYDPSRSAEVPKRLLRDFEGYLQTDGYEGYTALGQEPGIVHVGCWAHARRKFDEALRGQGKSKKKGAKRPAKESRARQALSQIQALYRIFSVRAPSILHARCPAPVPERCTPRNHRSAGSLQSREAIASALRRSARGRTRSRSADARDRC